MAKQDLNFSITATNEDLIRKLRESRQAILDSGKTAETGAVKIQQFFKKAAASAVLGFSAISIGKEVIRVRGEIQMMEKSFEVLLGSKTKAAKMIAEIKQLAIDSPLEMPQVSGAVQTLLGFGVSANKVMGIVRQLSDVSMGNADRFKSLALVYAQCQSAGKLMGQDLLQMIGAGFNPLKIISEQTGKSMAQLKDEMSKGAISAEMVADAFTAVTSEGGKFYQMTQKQADGIVGLQATFEDSITNTLNRYGTEYEDLIEGGYKFATGVVENSDTIIKALLPLVAAYGAYKALIIAVSAYQKAIQVVEAAKALNQMTSALRRSTQAQRLLNQAMGANPVIKLISLIVAAGTALYLFANKADEATEAQAELSKSIEDETRKLDENYKALSNAKSGTKERTDAIKSFNSEYGEYLSNLVTDKSSVEDITKAYDEAKRSVIEFQIAKAKENFIAEPLADLTEKTSKFYNQLGDLTKELESPEQQARFTAYIDQAIAGIKNGETFNIDKIYDAFRASKAKQSYKNVDDWKTAFREGKESFGPSDIDIIDIVGGWDISGVNLLGKGIQRLQAVMNSAENDFIKFSSAYSEVANPEANNNQDGADEINTFAKQLETARRLVVDTNKELQNLRKGIAPENSGNNYDFKKAIEEKSKELKDAELSYATLSGIDSKVSQKDYSSEFIDLMLKTEQMKIEVMQEGRAKELAQIELTRQEKLASIDKEQKDIEAKLKEQGKQLTPEQKASFDTQRTSVGLSANKDTVAVNKKYDDEIADGWRALTDVFLSEEEKRTGSIKNEYENRRKWLDELSKGGSINREEYIKMSLQIDASEAKAELQPLLDQYQTYADKRKKIEEKFQADRKTLQNADGSLKPGVKQGNVDELDNAKEKALQSLKFDEAKEGVDLTKLFGNLDNLTLPSMKTLRDKIKVWIDEAGNSLSPEDLKAVSDAFLKLEIKIADKDPFSVLKSSIADYKTSTKEVAEAQELYNKALRENGKDSEVAKQAAEKLTKVQEDRAASLAKANEAIKSVASDGQQIVGAAQDVIGILTDLGVKVPENAKKALGGIGQVMEGLGSIDLMKPMTIVTGAVKMIGGWVTTITSLFGGHKELANELERRNQESREKAYLAELEINQLYRDRYDWAQKIGESNLSYIKRQGEELNNQANANDKEQKDLWDKLSKSEYKSGEHIEKTGLFGWGREIKEDWSSLSGKSWDEIEKLASSGALSEEGMKYYEALKKAREEGEDLRAREQEYLESVREITTGSTYEGVVNGIVEGFKAGKRSAADFADSFEDLMSSAVGSALNSLANEKSRAWFEKFAEMGKDGYTTEETSELKADWIKLNEDLAEEAKNLESITGVSLGGNVQNDNSLTGQIKGSVATEASVAELGGLFRSQADSLLRIDSKMDLGFGELSELARSNAAIEANTRATANNTANTVTTLASGFTAMHTELTAINKNTSKDTGSYGG